MQNAGPTPNPVETYRASEDPGRVVTPDAIFSAGEIPDFSQGPNRARPGVFVFHSASDKTGILPAIVGGFCGGLLGAALGAFVGFVAGPLGVIVGCLMGALAGLVMGALFALASWSLVPRPVRIAVSLSALAIAADWVARRFFSVSLFDSAAAFALNLLK